MTTLDLYSPPQQGRDAVRHLGGSGHAVLCRSGDWSEWVLKLVEAEALVMD